MELQLTADDEPRRMSLGRLGLFVFGTAALAALLTNGPTQVGANPLDPAAMGSVGSLVGQHHEIHIVATSDGVRYTVVDQAGSVLAFEVTAEILQTGFPALVVPGIADHPDAPATTLMLADEPTAF